jgi:hypothetical protein
MSIQLSNGECGVLGQRQAPPPENIERSVCVEASTLCEGLF